MAGLWIKSIVINLTTNPADKQGRDGEILCLSVVGQKLQFELRQLIEQTEVAKEVNITQFWTKYRDTEESGCNMSAERPVMDYRGQ